MNDEIRNGDGQDVLDSNIERLIAVAPERARLDDGARDRMRAALRAHATSGSTARGENSTARETTPRRLGPRPLAPPALRRVMAIVAAVAAAALLIVLGIRGLTSNDDDAQVAGGGNAVSPGSTVGPDALAAGGGNGGARSATSEPDDLKPLAAAGSGDGSRTVAGADSGSSTVAAGAGDANDAAVTAGSIQAQLSFDASIESLPEQLIVWVKPMVDLPQVADPVAHTVALVPSGEAAEGAPRVATFALPGALEPARAMGATEVLVQIEASGAAPARTIASFEQLAQSALTFSLTAGVTVRGFVVDARTGTPLASAFVVALDQLPLDVITVAPTVADGVPRPYTTTDANGAFSLAHVMPADAVTIRASHAGFAPSVESVHLDTAAPGPVRLELSQGSAVQGLVEHPDGTRWEGALVIASSQATDPTARPRAVMTAGLAVTDASGRYSIENLPAGPYVVLLFGTPTSETPSPIGFTQVVIRGKDDETVNFLAPASVAGPAFTGTLVDEHGQPVASASITLTGAADGTASRSNWRATETGEDGSFSFVGIDSGPYVLHLATQSYMRMDLLWRGTIDGPTECTIELAGASWTIECLGAADGAPRAGAWVIVELYDLATSRWDFGGRGTTDVDGAITYPHLPAGRYRATVSGVGAGNGHVILDAVELFAGARTSTTLEIPEGNPLFVRVLDGPDGRPVEGAIVVIKDADGVVVPQPETAKTNASGVARNLSVSYGDVVVVVETALGTRTEVHLRFRDGGPGQPEPFDVIVGGN